MKRYLALLLTLCICCPLLAHEAKKYRLKIGDQVLVVELEEITEPAPVDPPAPPPVDPPAPPPAELPKPPEPPHDHAVMVMPDAVMMGNERTPRFAAGSRCVAVKSGPWSDPSTWTLLPVEGDSVQIPEGLTVTYDRQSKAKLGCIEISGCLEFAERDTELWASELMVLPSGCLCVEPGEHRAEIVFPDGPLRASDTGQAGRGLIAFGEVRIQGRPMANTFVRIADAPAGATKIQLTEAVDWPVGSEVLLPDTRQINPSNYPPYYAYAPQWEVRRVKSVSSNVLELDRPLAFAHRGPRDWSGKPVKGFDGAALTPHVACLSRSVVFRSENPAGIRGHVQFICEAKVSVRHAEFRDLGRTKVGPLDNASNHIGRYAVHFHHVVGPQGGVGDGYQFKIDGCTIRGGLKWGITIHDSHFGLIRGNVVHDIQGAGIAGEAGSERGNLFEGNFICGITGRGEAPPAFNGMGGTNDFENGDLGDGFWFAGPMNSVRNNVVANAQRTAYMLWGEGVPGVGDRWHRLVQAPASPGGPMQEYNVVREAFKDFSDNECYGATTTAVTIWTAGDRTAFPGDDRNTLTNTVSWNLTGIGHTAYNVESTVVDGWLHVGEPSMIGATIERGTFVGPSSGEALDWAGASCRHAWFRGVQVMGTPVGMVQRASDLGDSFEFDGATIDAGLGLDVWCVAQHPADGSVDAVYRNVLFGDTYSPGSLRAVRMNWNPPTELEALSPETLKIVNYQRIEGLSLELFYREQAKALPGGGIPKGRLAPADAFDGRALGIDGLVVVTNHPVQPLIFANVLLEQDKPRLYYAVIGGDDNPAVTVTFGGKSISFRGSSGSMPLDAADGLRPLKVSTNGAEVSKMVQFPVKR